MGVATSRRPDWDRLFETAAGQEGLFTTQQAVDAGYSPSCSFTTSMPGG